MPRIVIIGAGLSGMATAHYLVKSLSDAGKEAEILLLEADAVPGGKMRTIRQDGFSMEWGPNGFLTNKPHGMELVKDLGLGGRLARSSDLARKRFILSGGKLHRLPETPPAFFTSQLLSLPGRLRILWEPFASGPPADVDESLGEFARRRLGPEALEKLIDPMVTGIFAGDPDKMSLRSCFPDDLRPGAEVRRAGPRDARRAEGAGETGREGGDVRGAGRRADVVRPRGAGDDGRPRRTALGGVAPERGRGPDRAARGEAYVLSMSADGKREEMAANVVVIAAPAYAAAGMVSPLDEGLSELLAGIPYSPVTVAALGYRKATMGNPLDGFGFLIPRGEKRKILGALWDSSVFPNRAPEGKALLRVMVGGVRAPALAALPEADLLAVARKELQEIMGISAEPVLAKTFFHDRGIPQYLVGHGKRLERIDGRLAGLPGLHLNSNAYRGIALNDCVRESRATAERIAKTL